MNGIENATTGMSNSTGNMMRDMVLRGPSSFDALCEEIAGSADDRLARSRV